MNNINNWTISKLYLYLIALITFLILLFNFIILVRVVPGYFFSTSSWEMDRMSARDQLFVEKYGQWPIPDDPEHIKKMATITPEEIEYYRNKRLSEDIQRNKQMHLKDIIRNLFSFIILLPLHIYFFKLAKRS